MKETAIIHRNLRRQLLNEQDQLLTEVLIHSSTFNYSFIRLREGASLVVHESTGDIAMQIISGQGKLALESEVLLVEEGDFIFMSAHTVQRLEAETEMAILHVLTH